MKKILFTLLILTLAVVAHSTWKGTTATAITSASYTAIELPSTSGCTAFQIYTEDESAFYTAEDAAGTNEALRPDGFFGAVKLKRKAGDAVIYVKGTSSTNLVLDFIN